MGEKVTKAEAERWIRFELEKAFPKSHQVLEDIELRWTFKDVTFASLNQPKLKEELKRAFPAVPWDKPFDEFQAAKEKGEKK